MNSGTESCGVASAGGGGGGGEEVDLERMGIKSE
jgi:hypothetical protein